MESRRPHIREISEAEQVKLVGRDAYQSEEYDTKEDEWPPSIHELNRSLGSTKEQLNEEHESESK